MQPFPRIYPIVNFSSRLNSIASDPFILAKRLIEVGAQILQLRAKEIEQEKFEAIASQVVTLSHKLARNGSRTRIIINDRVDICRKVNADGVHLGDLDVSPYVARQELGAGAIIGFSTHTFNEAVAAQDFPIDYFALGPIFTSVTKSGHAEVVGLSLLSEIRRQISISCQKNSSAKKLPLVAIGGIDFSNFQSVLQNGADSVAIISAFENTSEVEALYKSMLTNACP